MFDIKDGCYARRALEMYQSGLVDEQRKKRIEVHLGHCLICYTAMKRVRRSDGELDRALKKALFSEKCAPPALRATLQNCLACARRPGAFRCPRLCR